MAVLPADKAWPRGGLVVRKYEKRAPLFATQTLKFSGVEYRKGAPLPVGQMTAAKHWELWASGKADHTAPVPLRRAKQAVEKLDAPERRDVVANHGNDKIVAVRVTAQGPTVSIATPAQADAKATVSRGKRR